MRAWGRAPTFTALAVVLGVAGCGIVSGLDSLEIADASVQDSALPDVPNRVEGGAVDGGGDALTTGLDCGLDAGNAHCFGVTCLAGEVCCVQKQQPPTCVVGSSMCPMGATLACTDPNQCAVDSGTHCCLQNVTVSTATCPFVVSGNNATTQGLQSNCSDCAYINDAGNARICSDNTDCKDGTTCYAVQLQLNSQAKLGICL